MKRLGRLIMLLILIIGFPSFCYARDDSIDWTAEELAFMEEHPVIRLGVDPMFVPFEFFDNDGTYQGITSDYLEIISEKTGLEMQVIKGLTWTEAYEKALHGEVDMLPAISKTSAREQYFLFQNRIIILNGLLLSESRPKISVVLKIYIGKRWQFKRIAPITAIWPSTRRLI
jgi:Bacterial extracellular solute-binding proteins, family 3.